MLTRRRATRIDHSTGDPHLVPGLQKTKQAVEIHAHRRAGVEGDGFPEALAHNFHQQAEPNAVRIGGNKVDDVVSVDGDGVGHEFRELGGG